MATPAPLDLKRHYSELSEKETEELVAAVADLIVDFLKASRDMDEPCSSGGALPGPELQS